MKSMKRLLQLAGINKNDSKWILLPYGEDFGFGPYTKEQATEILNDVGEDKFTVIRLNSSVDNLNQYVSSQNYK